jgi:ABC-type Fe3+ transport system permease subunit
MANLNELAGLAVVLVVVTIAISMGALVLAEIQGTDSVTENSTAWNATQEGLSGLDTAAGFLPVIAIVVVAAVIIGIVAKAFKTGNSF